MNLSYFMPVMLFYFCIYVINDILSVIKAP